MEILFIMMGIALFILMLYILYLVIEPGVRKGIDNSKTGKVIQEYFGVPGKVLPPVISNEEIEEELERLEEEGETN
ncbi:hypothetical protein D3H55_04240 [Bacillus salacetis]|uniref:Uncharacterized protein n=1 Tax=Bacillus salacetis TaxID=2315464 RepID=A0A3A1R3X0_9BACI|nr:hypothetical protein [Bacillus salacetis]RIW37259.1 hypothetical protein D3H55_04240 [Bacillus salacetis]